MTGQHRLQVAGIDVEAPGDDHVLLAVDDGQEALVVEAADVAGADEAATLRIEPFGLAGGLRPVVIAAHHHRRPTDHLANLADRQLGALLVDDADLVAGRGLADGVQLVRPLVGRQYAGAAALGHAVGVDQPAGPAAQDLGLEHRA